MISSIRPESETQKSSLSDVRHALPPTPGEIRSHLDPESRTKSYFKALVLFGAVLFLYSLTFIGTISPIWWLQLISIVPNGLSIAMLFAIAHDACHSCYTPSRKLDHWIARFAFLPSLWPYECWKVGHNYMHHGYTCLRGVDYAWQPLSLSEYLRLPRWRKWVERHYKTHIGLGTYWIVEIWWKHGVTPRGDDWRFLNKKRSELQVDRVMIIVFLCLLITSAGFLHCYFCSEFSLPLFATGVVTGVVLPFIAWAMLVGMAVFVQHTHPRTVWFEDKFEWSFFAASIQGTVHFRYPFPINKLFLDVMEHNAHHVDPTIPIYNLLLQQRKLEEAYPEDVIVEDFSVATMNRILGTCQLYDYKHHCWLSFDGKPTTDGVNLTYQGVKLSK